MPFLFPNTLLSEGMRSAVSCQVLEGDLPISFSWSRDGQEASSSSSSSSSDPSVTVRSNDEYSSTLLIERLSSAHSGNYTCTATNAAGGATHTAELVVKGGGNQLNQFLPHIGKEKVKLPAVLDEKSLQEMVGLPHGYFFSHLFCRDCCQEEN